MKFYIILLIFLLLKESKEEFNLKKRIEGSVKYILSLLENIQGENKTLIFKYPHYKISFSNFRIISPIIDNITLEDTDFNSSICEFQNISFGFLFDYILYLKSGNIIMNKDNYLHSTFSSLRFNYYSDDEFLSFDSFGENNQNLNTIKTNLVLDLETLNYFKDFNEKKICFCKSEKNEEYKEYKLEDPNIFILKTLKDSIKYYISKFDYKNIILMYDIYTIFNKTLDTIECSQNTKTKYKILTIKMNKILISSENIRYQINLRNKLWIDQIKFYGIYYSSDYSLDIDFSFELNTEEENVISLKDKKMQFDLNSIIIKCEFCEKNPKENEALKYAIKNDYGNCLNEAIKNYYYNSN